MPKIKGTRAAREEAALERAEIREIRRNAYDVLRGDPGFADDSVPDADDDTRTPEGQGDGPPPQGDQTVTTQGSEANAPADGGAEQNAETSQEGAVVEPDYEVVKVSTGWYDVVHVATEEVMNHKHLREAVAEEFIKELMAGEYSGAEALEVAEKRLEEAAAAKEASEEGA
ncbi:MAG: hypothetical protein ROR55_19950 [Devosia sp.]